MCCRITHCCFCVDHLLGVKVLAVFLILLEVAAIALGALLLPQFLFAIAPTSSIGIFCDIFLLVAAVRTSRWLILPWLIYAMIIIVGLGLAAVLRVVIPLGSVVNEQDWLVIVASSVAFLAAAGLLMYFWIVVLELFIRMGPFQNYDGVIYGQALPMGPQYVGGGFPVQQYAGYQPAMVYQAGPIGPPHTMRK